MNARRSAFSALWAGYGDALGFITELRDAVGVKRKIKSTTVLRPVSWQRRVGGRFGVDVDLPRGCYSDDTQLRLATCRAIRDDGTFDAEAFAKVELPIWLAYQLGGGRGTKAAARNLVRRDVTWFSNFFEERETSYVEGGGNGAAMRIQPHVWAAVEGASEDRMILDVMRNALTTHGHPRGFLGAVFHAKCLHYALLSGNIPGPDVWEQIVRDLAGVEGVLRKDEQLAMVWLPTWEARVGQQLGEAIRRVQAELLADIRAVGAGGWSGDQRELYAAAANRIGALEQHAVGSGTKTALLAAALCHIFRDAEDFGIVVAANLLGSDTDTIASMAGAIAGSVAEEEPPTLPLDAGYIKSEAIRVSRTKAGQRRAGFTYPDLFRWRAPRVQIDAVGVYRDLPALAGLGHVSQLGKVLHGSDKEVGWAWMRLDLGQSILVKRRQELIDLPEYQMPRVSEPVTEGARYIREVVPQEILPKVPFPPVTEQPTLFEPVQPKEAQLVAPKRNLDSLSDNVIRSGFHPDVLGNALLSLIDESSSPIEEAVAFVAIVAKARLVRRRLKS